jgi:hypothetical protein
MKQDHARRIKNLSRFFAFSCLVLLGSCAYQPEPAADNPPGFFAGIFQGFLILFSLIGSIFSDIRIYSFPNSGGWYDLGYFLGASAFLGGGGATAR